MPRADLLVNYFSVRGKAINPAPIVFVLLSAFLTGVAAAKRSLTGLAAFCSSMSTDPCSAASSRHSCQARLQPAGHVLQRKVGPHTLGLVSSREAVTCTPDKRRAKQRSTICTAALETPHNILSIPVFL